MSLLVIGFLFLLTIGLPLYITLFGISGALYLNTSNLPLVSMTVSFQKLQGQEFVAAIPLFIFAGYLLARSKSPERLIELFNAQFSWLKGADAIIVVLLMAFFTPLTGASGIGILAIGGLMLPMLIKNGRNENFSLGLITSSGSIGLMLAPSLPVIMYSIIAAQNDSPVKINDLFKAALIPTALLIGVFLLYIFIRDFKTTSTTTTTPFSLPRLLAALKGARYELPIPVIIYGGIYTGLFTVMEAALVIAVYVFIIEFILYKDFSLKKDFVNVTVESMKLSGGIFIIMATAFILTNYLVSVEMPMKTFKFIAPYIHNPFVFLIAINFFLLLVGGLLDIFSAILVVLPILLPIVNQYHINPYHFALIFLMNLELGYLIPPHGMNLFIASYSFKKPITFLYKVSVPFIILIFGVLIAITYIPGLSTITLNELKVKNDRIPPSVISTLSISTQNGTNYLNFIAVGDDGVFGQAEKYEIKYSKDPITKSDDFEYLEEMETSQPLASEKREKLPLVGLKENQKYYLVIRALDKKGNAGLWSDPIELQTTSSQPPRH